MTNFHRTVQNRRLADGSISSKEIMAPVVKEPYVPPVYEMISRKVSNDPPMMIGGKVLKPYMFFYDEKLKEYVWAIRYVK